MCFDLNPYENFFQRHIYQRLKLFQVPKLVRRDRRSHSFCDCAFQTVFFFFFYKSHWLLFSFAKIVTHACKHQYYTIKGGLFRCKKLSCTLFLNEKKKNEKKRAAIESKKYNDKFREKKEAKKRKDLLQ